MQVRPCGKRRSGLRICYIVVFPVIVVVGFTVKTTSGMILFVVVDNEILIRWRVWKFSMNSAFEVTIVRLFEEGLVSCFCHLLFSAVASPSATSWSMASSTRFPTVSTPPRAIGRSWFWSWTIARGVHHLITRVAMAWLVRKIVCHIYREFFSWWVCETKNKCDGSAIARIVSIFWFQEKHRILWWRVSPIFLRAAIAKLVLGPAGDFVAARLFSIMPLWLSARYLVCVKAIAKGYIRCRQGDLSGKSWLVDKSSLRVKVLANLRRKNFPSIRVTVKKLL